MTVLLIYLAASYLMGGAAVAALCWASYEPDVPLEWLIGSLVVVVVLLLWPLLLVILWVDVRWGA